MLAAIIVDGEYYEDEDEFQRAIVASIEDQSNMNVLQLMLQSKQVFKANEVLPLLGKQLEYVSRLCFDRIKTARVSPQVAFQRDIPALVELWYDLQCTISLGFQSMYSIEEQKELLSYSVKNTEEWMHMVPAVSMALSNDEFLLTFISSKTSHRHTSAKKKGKINVLDIRSEAYEDNSGDSVLSEQDSKHYVDVSHVTQALKNLKKFDISISSLICSVFDDSGCIPFDKTDEKEHSSEKKLNKVQESFTKNLIYIQNNSLLSTLRSFVSFFLIKSVAAPSASFCAPECSDVNNVKELLEAVVQVVNVELQELSVVVPKKISSRCRNIQNCTLTAETESKLTIILSSSVTSKLLTCLGGFFVCNHSNINHVAIFIPFAVQLLHIYQQSNAAFRECSSRQQDASNIGLFMQEWLLNEMRWVILFISSAVNMFFSVNDDKHLGRFKHQYGKSGRSIDYAHFLQLIDVSAMISSPHHKMWKSVDDTVKIWCSICFSDMKERLSYSTSSPLQPKQDKSQSENVNEVWQSFALNLRSCFHTFIKGINADSGADACQGLLSSSSWFVNISSFFSHISLAWMAKFTSTFNALVSLSNLDKECVALLVSSSTDIVHSQMLEEGLYLIKLCRENSEHLVDEIMHRIASQFGSNMCRNFTNWIKLLRVSLFALFCRYFDLDSAAEQLQTLSKTRNLSQAPSLLLEKLTNVWFLTFMVCGMSVQNFLHVSALPNITCESLTSRMCAILQKCLDFVESFVKSFDLRSQEFDLLMTDESVEERVRVSESIKWVTEKVFHEFNKSSPTEASPCNYKHNAKAFLNVANNNGIVSSAVKGAIFPLVRNIADLSMVLLAETNVSVLERMCLIDHLCQRGAIYGVQICTETLSLLRDSKIALSYFAAGLEFPQFQSNSCRFNLSNICVHQKRLPIDPDSWQWPSQHVATINKPPHLKKQSQVICSLDNCISEIFATISKDIFTDCPPVNMQGKVAFAANLNMKCMDLRSVGLFPKLIDTLRFVIRSAFEDFFHCNSLSLASPLLGFSTLMNLVNAVGVTKTTTLDKDQRNWSIILLLRQYVMSTYLLQMTINELSETPTISVLSSVSVTDNTSLVNTERGIETLRNCNDVINIVENMSGELGDMRFSITKQCIAADTKIYLPQIRLLEYSSPVIIPNTCTDFGNYAIGFWLRIPKGYKRNADVQHDNQKQNVEEVEPKVESTGTNLSPRSNLKANSAVKQSTHILSRVPEAGDVDMFNLFRGVPTTLCNPGIILEVLPDGTALLVVTITSPVDSNGEKTTKRIRMVKLSSKPLPVDEWIDVTMQFTCLFEDAASKRQESSQRVIVKERSVLRLFINGELHSTAEDCFGRLSLHQNVIFGTTPKSLIMPQDKNECLQAGWLRWSTQPQLSACKVSKEEECGNSNSPNSPVEGLNILGEINIASPLTMTMKYEPLVCEQNVQENLSDVAQYTLNLASHHFLSITNDLLLRLNACLCNVPLDQNPMVKSTFNSLIAKPQNSSADKAVTHLETLISLLPLIGHRAACLLADSNSSDAVHESVFQFMSTYIEVLVSVKSFVESKSRILSVLGTKLRTAVQSACSALQLLVSYLLRMVEILVRYEAGVRKDSTYSRSSLDNDSNFVNSFPDVGNNPSDTVEDNMCGGDMSSLLNYWLFRLQESKLFIEEKLFPTDVVSAWILSKGGGKKKQNENTLVTNIAAVTAKAVNSNLISISKIILSSQGPSESFGKDCKNIPSLHMMLVVFFAGGGWPVSIQGNSVVDIFPRALFLHVDPKGLECAAFPATAHVHSLSLSEFVPGSASHGQGGMVSTGRAHGVWLNQCSGIFGRHMFPVPLHSTANMTTRESVRVHFAGSADHDDVGANAVYKKGKLLCLNHSLLVPRQPKLLVQATEMVATRDLHIPMSLANISHVMKISPMGDSLSLLSLLQRLSKLSSNIFTVGNGRKTAPVFAGHRPTKSDMETVLPSHKKDNSQEDQEGSSGPSHHESELEEENPALELTMIMSHIRSLLVQLTTAECALDKERTRHFIALQGILERDLQSLISIALLDPVNSVVQAFQKASSEQQQVEGTSESHSTGQQLDVLSNLLREGDICFLEKISLRVWKHFHSSNRSKSERFRNSKPSIARHQPTPLSGEVQILGNRIRALSHFPSVKIYPVSLEKMSGRWFYECTLLSDGKTALSTENNDLIFFLGLMQIGWADRLFRSDPVCGQGVGDHLHSWAVDGLR